MFIPNIEYNFYNYIVLILEIYYELLIFFNIRLLHLIKYSVNILMKSILKFTITYNKGGQYERVRMDNF